MKKILIFVLLFFVFSFKVNALQYSLWVKDTTAPKIDNTYFGSRDLNNNSVEYQISGWTGTYPQKTDYVYISVMLSSKNTDLSIQEQQAYYINYARTYTVYLKHRYAGKVACQRLTSNGYGSFDTFKCPSFVNNNEDKVVAIGFEHPITINPTPVQIFVFNKYFTFEIDENLVESKEQTKVLNEIHKNLTEQLEQANQNSQKEIDAINKQTEATKEQTETIKDSNVDVDDSFFSGFDNETHGLTAIITSPLQLIGSIASSTCSPLTLEIPFVNQTAYLPCLKQIYEQYFGSFFTLYQTITFGIVSYCVCVNIFAMVKGFKDPDSDRIEVLDL